jgi:hypothetical protein
VRLRNGVYLGNSHQSTQPAKKLEQRRFQLACAFGSQQWFTNRNGPRMNLGPGLPNWPAVASIMEGAGVRTRSFDMELHVRVSLI